VANPSQQPANIPSGSPDQGRQLGLLLEAAKNMVDEEFRRTERLENKARTAFSSAGALFAVVMATTAGILNALLNHGKVAAGVYVVLGGAALLSIVALAFAFIWTLKVQDLIPTDALNPDDLDKTYLSFAEQGNVGVGKRLIEAYAQILRDRRKNNETRAENLKCTTTLCTVAALSSLVQLAAVFVALITR